MHSREPAIAPGHAGGESDDRISLRGVPSGRGPIHRRGNGRPSMSEHTGEAGALDVGAQIRNRLIKDLKEDNFVLYFQSIVAIAPSVAEPLYREILVRFKEEEKGLMPPGMFLPNLEQHGLMPLLDRWVTAQVLKWTRSKQAVLAPRPTPRCSINLSR